ADAVKMEVDQSFCDLVARMSRAGVPVVAHLGSRPQHVRRQGGYRAAGRTAVEARALIDQARRMEDSGAVLLLLEATTAEVSQRIVEAAGIPVIGCGAGPACHGEVVVLHDLLGLTDWQPPFAPPQAQMGQAIADAAASWVQQVGRGGDRRCEHPYRMSEDERRRLDED
ncbi:MAG: 3-methyl-2-oxobutanoate hydroxymethyltransferase, partial [Phycisphaerae bacterium]|nr:3-methyl-2-oxobutanoate hydroxymethyltransferase [Phycisphaerae bacterium]